jgi:hypothetical protein
MVEKHLEEKDLRFEEELARAFLDGDSAPLETADLTQSDPTYDEEARNIYSQSHRHRDGLVDFYKKYTSWFTAVVLVLIVAQAIVRISTHDSEFEIMPQWTLNILVTGMFGQFLVLLKIVTKSVWNFDVLFKHHNEMRNGHKDAEG